MNNELELGLTTRHPYIYPPASGLDHFGFECLDGWAHLLDAAGILIQRHVNTSSTDQVVAQQVKEKFGELRIYVSNGDEYVQAILDLVEGISAHYCEVCGVRGSIIEQKGSLIARCAEHRAPSNTFTPNRAHQTRPTTEYIMPAGLEDVLDAGLQLFERQAKHYLAWLITPAIALNSEAPIDQIGSPEGCEQVLKLIRQIELGITP